MMKKSMYSKPKLDGFQLNPTTVIVESCKIEWEIVWRGYTLTFFSWVTPATRVYDKYNFR